MTVYFGVIIMKFTRVNKDTVNCIITEDDMDEQGLRLEDLFDLIFK